MACSSASICYPATPATGGTSTAFRAGSSGVLLSSRRRFSTRFRTWKRLIVRSDLDSNVSDMRNNGN